ncbi:MAG TPA: hypothetical protein VJL58_12280 [Pyrinomonadaceae bacterium]|nr:hypothetical protein [Pyrinomonadaceae bacterium]
MGIWHELLKIAVNAPSPHNVQPWRLKIINEAEAELYIDSTRTLPKEDVTGSFIILTMGLFIEALAILADLRSLRLAHEMYHEPEWLAPAILEATQPTLIPFAKLTLKPSHSEKGRYDEPLFLKRRTSRLCLHDREIPAEVFDELKKVGIEWHQTFSVVTDTQQIERLLKLNTDAVFEDLNSAGYHDEITEWFRYSDRDARDHLDGLDARCMNVAPINLWLAAQFPKLMLFPFTRQILAKVYRSQSGKVRALGVISGGFWKPVDAIDAGRFLMRFWLETALHNVYIHPYGNLVTNPRAAEEMEKELGVRDIWLIFRIGYSDEPPKSYRLPIERTLIAD